MANEILSAIIFIIGVIVSTIIIFVVTKLFAQKEGIGRAFVTALIGAIVYSVVYFLLGNGWLAAIVGGIVWLLALRALYDIGWLKALAISSCGMLSVLFCAYCWCQSLTIPCRLSPSDRVPACIPNGLSLLGSWLSM